MKIEFLKTDYAKQARELVDGIKNVDMKEFMPIHNSCDEYISEILQYCKENNIDLQIRTHRKFDEDDEVIVDLETAYRCWFERGWSCLYLKTENTNITPKKYNIGDEIYNSTILGAGGIATVVDIMDVVYNTGNKSVLSYELSNKIWFTNDIDIQLVLEENGRYFVPIYFIDNHNYIFKFSYLNGFTNPPTKYNVGDFIREDQRVCKIVKIEQYTYEKSKTLCYFLRDMMNIYYTAEYEYIRTVESVDNDETIILYKKYGEKYPERNAIKYKAGDVIYLNNKWTHILNIMAYSYVIANEGPIKCENLDTSSYVKKANEEEKEYYVKTTSKFEINSYIVDCYNVYKIINVQLKEINNDKPFEVLPSFELVYILQDDNDKTIEVPIGSIDNNKQLSNHFRHPKGKVDNKIDVWQLTYSKILENQNSQGFVIDVEYAIKEANKAMEEYKKQL